ncbi:MAG: DUF4156 domain-containing protein [Thiogranum sp.]|nr:DUF4156 domain-containing protein [Thiogranum sp.]
MKRSSYAMLLVVVMVLTSSCTWVKSTEEGARVKVLTAEQVQDCRKAGNTQVSVLGTVGVIRRSESLIAEELVTLAANSAAQLGGNAIVPVSGIEDGSQTFAVYDCDPEDLRN